ncbi:molybdenum cofactor guanylyltransferase MobA [Nitrincola alkalilacustris]|uniref:molybdenum cofactor guanylyltransferase MobA n=1 Tax=Nitrincola alkalilacustris TaxID=1571224 RepID=UPI00124C2CB1|nr:molybdenum cofactor guanylyltransferase MobA [Nitrincola alkalilacustris]
MTLAKEKITAVVLAGGRGQRMGGEDKGWVLYQEKPLIEHIIERLSPQVGELIINANRNIDRYSSLGYSVFKDLDEGFQGPLMGIATGLTHATGDWVVFVPCDGPFIPLDLVARLSAEAVRSEQPIVVASDGEWLQPMVVMMRRSVLPELMKALAANERKPDRWYASVGMSEVSFPPEMLHNFNRPEDIKS